VVGLTLREPAGAVHLQTDDGALHLTLSNATEVVGSTGSGKIEATLGEVAERVELHSDDGSLRVVLRSAGSVRLSTGSGEIVLEIAEGVAEGVEVHSDDGSLRLRVAESFGFRLEARTEAGAVRCAMPMSAVETTSNEAGEEYRAVRNEGTVPIRLHTGAGDITVHT